VSDRDGAEEPGDSESGNDAVGEFAGEQPVEQGEGGRRRRGRRGRRGGRRDEPQVEAGAEAEVEVSGDTPAAEVEDALVEELGGHTEAPLTTVVTEEVPPAEPQAETSPSKSRRRPRARAAAAVIDAVEGALAPVSEDAVVEAPAVEAPVPEAPADEPAAKPRRGRRKPAAALEGEAMADAPAVASEEAPADTDAEAPAAKPRRRTRRKPVDVQDGEGPIVEAADAGHVVSPLALTPEAAPEAEAQPDGEETGSETVTSQPEEGPEQGEAGDGEPPRRGWWQRTFGA
jgi:ribonuclease E